MRQLNHPALQTHTVHYPQLSSTYLIEGCERARMLAALQLGRQQNFATNEFVTFLRNILQYSYDIISLMLMK